MRYYSRQSPVWHFTWLWIVVLMFTACSSQSIVVSTPTPQGTPTQIASGTPGPDATPTSIPIPSGTTNCTQISDFASAGSASPASGFTDLSFPAGSVSITTGPISHVYQFQIVNVCTNATTVATVQAYYNGKLPANGWATSSTYPYQANPSAACGAAICWRKGTPRRYVSLQDVHNSGSVVVYALWTAIAPVPSYTLTWRSNHISLPAGAPTTHVSASCNAGEQMLSGGFSIASPDGAHSADSTYPSSLTTWTVTAHNASASAITLWSYAGCLAANFSLGMTIVTNSTQAKCPSGGAITGGGYVYHSGATTFDEGPIPGPNSVPVTASPTAWDELLGSASVTEYGMCATHNIIGRRVAASSGAIITDIGHFTDVESANCPSGQVLTGGGYEVYDPSFPLIQHYFQSAPGPSGNWLVGGYAPGFSSDSEGVAVCNNFAPSF